jgi:hypothetical protein
MIRRDSSIQDEFSPSMLEKYQKSFDDNKNDSDYEQMTLHLDDQELEPLQVEQDNNNAMQRQRELTFTELLGGSRSCCVTLMITLIPSFLVGSWFTHVQTNWIQLPQILFYTRIGSDTVGRIATVVQPPSSLSFLSMTSVLRLLPVTFFFLWNNAASTTHVKPSRHHPLWWSDVINILLVAVISFLSGYLVTGCFQLAPGTLEVGSRDRNVAKQASLLNMAFSFAALLGLLASFSLIYLGL